MSIIEAIEAIRNGKFVMIHDNKSREDEVDLVISAQYIKPEDIAIMRTKAGGLICISISNEIASGLDLPYMHDILQILNNKTISNMIVRSAPYGDRSSFSISINHINTFTGITDIDRCTTIKMMHETCLNTEKSKDLFIKNFRTPGHIPLLIAAKNLLKERMGHTELSVELMNLSSLLPVAVICEMLDTNTHKSLDVNKAKEYSSEYDVPLVEARDIISYSGK